MEPWKYASKQTFWPLNITIRLHRPFSLLLSCISQVAALLVSDLLRRATEAIGSELPQGMRIAEDGLHRIDKVNYCLLLLLVRRRVCGRRPESVLSFPLSCPFLSCHPFFLPKRSFLSTSLVGQKIMSNLTLGDRRLSITLKRTLAVLTFWDKLRLLWGLLTEVCLPNQQSMETQRRAAIVNCTPSKNKPSSTPPFLSLGPLCSDGRRRAKNAADGCSDRDD